jgi:hypothetical protein
MKKTTKVTLLSLFLFPGAGHLLLKKYPVAAGFILSFTYLLISIIKEIHNKMQQVIESIIQGEIPMEINAIREALIEKGALEISNLTVISYLLLIIWCIAAFDAYRIANKDSHHTDNR